MEEHGLIDDKWILKYRVLAGAQPPQRIRLTRPGWAGDPIEREDGSLPQPWHCVPFMEGTRYGFELLYSLEIDCEVKWHRDALIFEGDFSKSRVPQSVWPPFVSTNPGHYSLGTMIDLEVPPGWILRTEPHPRFFNDRSETVPAAVIGNLQTSWWPMFFFVTFKSPAREQVHRFRKGDGYAQIIAVPETSPWTLRPMREAEVCERESYAQAILKSRKRLARRRWISKDRLEFDDLYSRLQALYRTGGLALVKEALSRSESSAMGRSDSSRQCPFSATEVK
jgi:hypothetical protein